VQDIAFRQYKQHGPLRSGLGVRTGLMAVVLASALWSGPASAAACFRYGEVVTLTGSHFTLAPPPADEIVRDPRNDAARRADLLILSAPYCVNADALSAGVSEASTIQLNCPAVDVTDGSNVTLTGRLIGAHTGNGHTPVLLACQK
jgi:hypothetical protein